MSLLAETGFVSKSDSKEPDMRTATRIGRKIARVKAIWAELDYAQRRLLEMRTGVPFIAPEERRRSVLRGRQLEYLYRS
jgi:hypothetical protein